MLNSEWLGFLVLSAMMLLLGWVLGGRRESPFPLRLVLAAVGARIFGCFARYEINERFYYGSSDAVQYHDRGLAVAEQLWNGDFSALGYEQWFGEGELHWWGTRFIQNISGLVTTVIGTTFRGEYVVFATFAFIGIYCIALAYRRVHPGPAARRYAALIFLWPTLWFWPSSIGKEAVLMLGIGVATLAYVGRRGKIRWPLLVASLSLLFALRPHVAGMVVLAVAGAHWVGSWSTITVRRVLESVAIFALAVFLLVNMQSALGIQSEIEGWEEFYSFTSGQTLTGGGNIGDVPNGWLAPVQATINIWLRPFVWEAHNATALLSAAEILLLWGFAWRRRQHLRLSVKNWRQDRLLRFALPFLLGYTLAIGLTFGNLGIIARQRTPAFPFFLMLLAPAASVAVSRGRARVPQRSLRAVARRRSWEPPTPLPADGPWAPHERSQLADPARPSDRGQEPDP